MSFSAACLLIFLLVIMYTIVRVVASRYFHEPMRAEVASGAITAAIFVGALMVLPWQGAAPAIGTPFPSDKAAMGAPATANSAAAISGSVHRVDSFRPQQDSQSSPVRKLLAGLHESDSKELFASLDIATVGGQATQLAHDPTITLRQGQVVSIEGWARDPATNGLPRTVFLVIDNDKAYRPVRQMARPDVAQFTHNTSLLRAGFSITIPTTNVPRGDHSLQLVVVGTHGKTFYRKTSGPQMHLTVD